MSAKHVVLGTGAIGRAIAEELVRRGESVRMANRSGRMDEVPAGVEVVASDLYDQARVREVTRGAKVVYQAAVPPYHEVAAKIPLFQRAILDGLSGNGAKLVIVENMYMYGATNGTPMTEETPHHAHTRKGQARREASKIAFEAHHAGKVRVTSARGSDYFGPWGTESATTFGSRQIYPLLQGKTVQMIGRTDIPHTHTYLKDFGKALVILGEHVEADGQAWGSLGFLTETALDRLDPVLDAVFDGACTLEERSMLEATVRHGGGARGPFVVLNDAVITKAALARMIEIEPAVDGAYLTTYRADGLIVATPRGSTAYSLAAGGPIVYPDMEAVVITPICPHTLTNRSLVVPGHATVELAVRPGAQDIHLTLDGQVGVALEPADRVRIRAARARTRLVHVPGHEWFGVASASATTRVRFARCGIT